MHPHAKPFNFNEKPFLVIWETTHACDLACVHCRASADPEPAPDELTHAEAVKMINEVAEMGTPIFVFSGGDPLKRADLCQLIHHAKKLNLRTGAIPAVTPLLTPEKIMELKKSGLDQIAFSLDAANPTDHDAFRKVDGVFERTLESVRIANEIGLSVQINSLINVHNTSNLDSLIALIEELNIVFWEVFFLVPVGRGEELPLLSAEKFDQAFEKIYQLSQRAPFIIKITEAPHYRKFYIDQEIKRTGGNINEIRKGKIELPAYLRKTSGPHQSIGRAPQGVNAGKGFIFVSHRGEVFPSGFLPLEAGHLRKKSLSDIYRNSLLLKELRDPSLLKGRCGICPYNEICGGSRSRAFVMTGDYLQEDPCCNFQPEANGV